MWRREEKFPARHSLLQEHRLLLRGLGQEEGVFVNAREGGLVARQLRLEVADVALLLLERVTADTN